MKQYFYGDYGLPSITFYCTLSCLVYSNCNFAEMFSQRSACHKRSLWVSCSALWTSKAKNAHICSGDAAAKFVSIPKMAETRKDPWRAGSTTPVVLKAGPLTAGCPGPGQEFLAELFLLQVEQYYLFQPPFVRCSCPLPPKLPFAELASAAPTPSDPREPRAQQSTPDMTQQHGVAGKDHIPQPGHNHPPNAGQHAAGLFMLQGCICG